MKTGKKTTKKVESIETKAGQAKAITTKKDMTKAIETRAGVLKEPKAKKETVSREIFLQFAGKEYSEEELMEKVKEVWTKKLKHDASELKDVKLYLKPEESAAYYVINKETTGKIEL